MTEPEQFDFEKALSETLKAIDIGPHCSCADITMELLRVHLPLPWTGARYAAAAFGGGVGGSGGPCGAFTAALVALSLLAGRGEPAGCVAEHVEGQAQAFYDAWLERHGTFLCSELTGYPSLRSHEVQDEFFSSGKVDECTDQRIRFAVETALKLASEGVSSH